MHLIEITDPQVQRFVELACWAWSLACIAWYVRWLRGLDAYIAEEKEKDRQFWQWYRWFTAEADDNASRVRVRPMD